MDFAVTLRARVADFGLTMQEVARRALLDEGRLDALANGSPPDLDELQRLGRVLVFDPYSVVRGEPFDDAGRSPARFKRPEGAHESLDPRDVFLLARAAEVARLGGWLLRLLGRDAPLARHRVVTPVQGDRGPWEQGYDLGAAAREAVARAGAVPAGEPMRNVQGCLESLGVHVADVTLESRVTGAALYEPDAMPVILLNRRSPRVRSRLSRRAALAHELCHLLNDGGERDLVTVTTRASPDPFEQRANGFAPAFLAPPAIAAAELGDSFGADRSDPSRRESLLRFARRWGLTPEGAAWHAKNCERLSPADAERLAQERWPEIETDFETALPRHEAPDSVVMGDLVFGLYSDLAIEAWRRDELSPARLEELLGR